MITAGAATIAILVGPQRFWAGDALLAWGGDLVTQASEVTGNYGAVNAFNHMCAEVALGQYLDVRNENLPLNGSDGEQMVSQSLAVIKHKSARYSVACPLIIGALLAGATPDSPAVKALETTAKTWAPPSSYVTMSWAYSAPPSHRQARWWRYS